MTLTILLVVLLVPAAAMAGDGDPSAATFAGYAIAGAGAITPLATILLSMGKKAGQAEEVQKQHGAELARLQAQHEAAEVARRGDIAAMITEIRAMREAHASSMERFGERVEAQLDRMLPKELAVVQMGAIESNVRSVAVERAVKDVVAPLVSALQPLIAAAARTSVPPNQAG